jgi:hypothetical protein
VSPNHIDLVNTISGVTFAEAWDRRGCHQADGLTMVFVDRDTLMTKKAAAGRPKDLADLDALS